MEYSAISNMKVTRVALGTWSIGGGLWGGSDENESIKTIETAFSDGINFFDTAPAYGDGKSEELLGKALKGKRDKAIIATKCGLNQETPNKTFRDSRRDFLFREIDRSLKRLQTDYIDIYLIHWPDPKTPIVEVAETLKMIKDQGKIKAIGVCNFNLTQLKEFEKTAPLDVVQLPYNLFEREQEENEVKYAISKKIPLMGYGPLCRGLLSGKMSKDRKFNKGDLREGMDPKFQEPRFSQYLECADKLEKWVLVKYQKTLFSLAVRWVLDKGINSALLGARKPEQLVEIQSLWDWHLTQDDFKEIDKIIKDTVKDPIGPQFMSPPERD
jgi:aryl-alcohol dehydrogenase-like predicted oxidoreductase